MITDLASLRAAVAMSYGYRRKNRLVPKDTKGAAWGPDVRLVAELVAAEKDETERIARAS